MFFLFSIASVKLNRIQFVACFAVLEPFVNLCFGIGIEIGIGIGSDITNVITSSIKPMDPKLRVVT